MDFEPNDQAFETDEEQTDDSDYDSNEQTDGSEATEDLKKSKTKRGEQGICVKCNKKKKIKTRSMCGTCYEKDLKIKHKSEGRMTANLVTCLKCNQLKKHKGRGLCNACYQSVKYLNQLEQYPKTRTKRLQRGLNGVCIQCNKTKAIYSSSMCRTCYENDLKARHKAGEKNCANCKRLRQLETNGFCSQCNLNNVESGENVLDQELEANSNVSDQELEVNSNALNHELERNSIDVKERLTTNFLVTHTDFVKHIELDDNSTTTGIKMQGQKMVDEISSASQLKESFVQTVLTSPLIFDSEDKRITTEDFIGKLAQYTRSKLKPLKKKQIKLSVKKPLKAKQSNLNILKEDDHVPQLRPIQLAKKSSKVPISKGPIPLIRLTKTPISKGPIAPIRLTKMPILKGPIAPIRLTKTPLKTPISNGPISLIRLTKTSSKSSSSASKPSLQVVKRTLKTLAIEAQAEEKTAKQINENLQKCSDCQQMKPHHARNLCSVCYQRFMTEKNKKKVATKSNTSSTGGKQFFAKQKIDVSQYELLFGTSRKRKLEQSDNETFSDDEFYSMF